MPDLSAIDKVLRQEYEKLVQDIVKDSNRSVFYGLQDNLPPVLGPPSPEWYELELDQFLNEGLTEEGLRLELLRLLDRVRDYYYQY